MIHIKLLFSGPEILPSNETNSSRRKTHRFNRSGGFMWYVFLFASFFYVTKLFAQVEAPVSGEGPRWFGTTGKSLPYDTSAQEALAERALATAGLLEGAIDPEQYHVGPNDILTVTIWTSRTQQYDILVTPDAKGLIQTVGEVNLMGKTLAEAEREIKKAVARVYNVDASVSLRRMREFKVNVIGAVRFPGAVTATPATRVSEVVGLAGGPLQRGNQRDILIYRRKPDGTREVIRVDLLPFFAFADLSSNQFVRDGDVIKLGIVDPDNVVQIYGEVATEGEYSFQPTDSISTIINASFGFTADARRDSILVISVTEAGEISSETWHSYLNDGTLTNDRGLQNGDRIFVWGKPRFRQRDQVVVAGEVQRPGVYPIVPGSTTLRELISMSGGFTQEASLIDAVLIRREAIGQPDEYFRYVNAIESTNRTLDEQAYFRTKLLELAKQGEMAVDFGALMNRDESQNIPLMNNDSLYVPVLLDHIRVSGKVKNPGHFLYESGAGYEVYVDRAGGYGWKAEKDETQVIKGRSGDRFPAKDEANYILESGDAIFVPEERPSNFWESFTIALTLATQTTAIVALVISLTGSNNP